MLRGALLSVLKWPRNPMSDSQMDPLHVDFDPHIKVEFHGSG
jgi:hypothetical protein